MYILLISSSPNKEKSTSLLLAKEVLKKLPCSVDTDIIHLKDLKIGFCEQKDVCHKKPMDCPIKDDAQMVMEKMLKADGIVFATPSYMNHVTASMKALFDRTSHFTHCKRLLGKYVAGVVTSGGGQNQSILDYIKYYANTCGAQYVGGVSSQTMAIKERFEEAAKLGNTLVMAIEKKKTFPDQIAFIEEAKKRFGGLIKMRKDDWSGEYKYYQDMGWM